MHNENRTIKYSGGSRWDRAAAGGGEPDAVKGNGWQVERLRELTWMASCAGCYRYLRGAEMGSGYEEWPSHEERDPNPVPWAIAVLILVAIVAGSIYFWPR